MKKLLYERDKAIDRINTLRVSGVRLSDIAEKLGDKKQYQSWVSRFSHKKISNPGIETLQAVIDALDELELSRTSSLNDSAAGLEVKSSDAE